MLLNNKNIFTVNKMNENFLYKKLTKTQRIREAKRRISEALGMGYKTLDFRGLGLENEDLKLIPEFPVIKNNEVNYSYGNGKNEKEIKEQFENNWYIIDLSHNNLTDVKNIPTTYYLILSYNNFTEVKNLPLVYYGDLSFNKIKSIELTNKIYDLSINNTEIKSLKNIKNIENLIQFIEFNHTPLEKKLIPHRKVDKLRINKYKNLSNIKYETYIIPKGTVLFRGFDDLEDLHSIYTGYEPLLQKDKDGNYYLHKDQYTFFYTSPRAFIINYFGDIRTVFVLQNDAEVLLGLKPAIRVKENMIMRRGNNIFFESCDYTHKVRKNSSYLYECLRPEYKEKNIAGWFSNWSGKASESSVEKLNDLKYTPMYETFHNDFYIPELAIYPRNKREFGDVITKVEDFNTEWLNSHMTEFNYKPLMIFDNTVSTEEYKEKILQFMKPEGFTDPETGETYHITVNKKDGTYILAELASEETLKDCLPVEAEKESYLIEFIKNQ